MLRCEPLLMSVLCVLVLPQAYSFSQDEGANRDSGTEAEFERLRAERRAFQNQQRSPARPGNWIFNPGEPPRIVWRDVDTVRGLGCTEPFRVRWFNARMEEHAVPEDPGRWGAWIEGTAPNGLPLRRALTFYARPPDFFVYPAPQVAISFPDFPGPIRTQVWKEHETDIVGMLKNLLFGSINDSESGAILLAGLSESEPLGRPARFVDSVAVRNEDYHLALKLKLQGLQDQVRPLRPPRRRDVPATALHEASLEEAGMHPDAKSKIDAVCRDWAGETGEPFVTLVARRGVIVTHEAFGTDPEGQPIETEYRCWVGSITKTVTALLFSQFLDQGLIDLDDSLATVFPDYPQSSPHVPTFRQCFNHTSGLTGHGDFGGARNPHLENIILNAIDVNEPNARYAYSGMGFDLAANAMELVAGKSIVRLYDEHLFQPLEFGDVPINNASSDGEFTARELAILGQWIANRGSYGEWEFISPGTFDRLLPKPLQIVESGGVHDEGIGLHWDRRRKPGAPPDSQRPEDLLLSPNTVRHGSFSGCIFVIDLDQQLVIVQARRRSGPRNGEWSSLFFETIAESVVDSAL